MTNNDARLTFRTSNVVNEALDRYAIETCRSKNSLINEAVHLYVADRVLHCSMKELTAGYPTRRRGERQ